MDYNELNLSKSYVIIREFPLKSGFADYLIFIKRKIVGVIEAKSEGTTLSGVDAQSNKYLKGIPEEYNQENPIPFAYESTGTETFFRDIRDPDFRSRRVFGFHKPETLMKWLSEEDTLRNRLKKFPVLSIHDLRNCQSEAIENLEKSLAKSKQKSLIQMATGSGKTFAAVSFIYRLVKFAGAKRILFLVDRSNLARQTLKEFQKYKTPDDGRKFTELYNVEHLESNTIDPVNKVCITTIQRLYSMLRGKEIDREFEEESLFDTDPSDREEMEISYNPEIGIETFDFIVTDECHRSIYNLWRQVLEYFDAFLIGLTATPSKQTIGFFNQNLVTEYSHERAVADGVNVGYEVYEIKTKISGEGSKVEKGFFIDKRDRFTRKIRWEKLDEDFEYNSSQLDRDVVAKDQIRTVIQTFKDNLPEIFPKREYVPKTLIFAKNDSHAEDIVEIVREEFNKGNEFCQKITYRTTGIKPEDLISEFRNSYNPRIAVSVDMVSTGTDIKPLECLLFMRNIKSQTYFEQMKGRGTRIIDSNDLKAVTPDALYKDHFIIVDAVGVCETDKNTDSRPLERKKNVSFDKLLKNVAIGIRDEDTITSLAGRLARLNHKINQNDRNKLKNINKMSIKKIINELLDAVDPDKKIEKASEMFINDNPTEDQIEKATKELVNEGCKVFDNPKFRNALIDIKKNEQKIDTTSKDEIVSSGFSESLHERAGIVIKNFKHFICENKGELTALELIYNKPYGQRQITYEQIKQVADALEKPPYKLNSEVVWNAYEQLDKSKIKDVSPQKLLTDIIQLIRYSIGEINDLQPFPEHVNQNFNQWISEQEDNGKKFTEEQMEWLNMIKDHIATSSIIDMDDFENVPFNNKGGSTKHYELFGNDSNIILKELNQVLSG
jgi:type I restriction enzyme R subunit